MATRKKTAKKPAKKRTPTTAAAEAAAIRIARTKERLLVEFAQKENRGMVASCCEQVGISRDTFYEYRNKDAKFAAAVEAAVAVAKEDILDFVEHTMFEIIKGQGKGAPSLIQYFLNYHGKNRGYNKSDNDGKDDVEPEIYLPESGR